MHEITVTAVVEAKCGLEAEVARELGTLAEASRHEPGCLRYEVHCADDSPRLFLACERWRSQEDLEQAEGIGPDRAELVAEWFADEDNRRLVEELRELGLTMAAGEAERPVEGPLSGRQYVITGTLEKWSRDEAKEALEALGAKVTDSVSKKTAGVIVGENPGSKLAKAQKAGVPVLDEAALADLLARRA